ncbi:hypothetical protein CC80DRAFT_13292 [Byssothecium circinans]|uniref:Uncharacterized protein n=1 Tax=Byssothecium circinans TaxID=147558 RepID=A0A6A5UJ44_9PLEO|nr:hypothetical protein CC80DRAFT_13292 [Byssothecium circinans]
MHLFRWCRCRHCLCYSSLRRVGRWKTGSLINASMIPIPPSYNTCWCRKMSFRQANSLRWNCCDTSGHINICTRMCTGDLMVSLSLRSLSMEMVTFKPITHGSAFKLKLCRLPWPTRGMR